MSVKAAAAGLVQRQSQILVGGRLPTPAAALGQRHRQILVGTQLMIQKGQLLAPGFCETGMSQQAGICLHGAASAMVACIQSAMVACNYSEATG